MFCLSWSRPPNTAEVCTLYVASRTPAVAA